MQRIAGQHHGVRPLARQYGEGAVEVAGVARLDRRERKPQARRRGAQLFEDHVVGDVVGIPQQRDAGGRRDDLLDQLQPLRAEVGRQNGVAGDVAAGMSEALHQAARTGSPTEIVTIGMVEVAALAARLAGVP